jgi:hypothetical protein
MHLEYTTAAASANAEAFADIVKDVEVEIGGQKIDKHYGEWLDIWYGLTTGADKPKVEVLGAVNETGFVPLQFWFNRNAGLALPLIALQYHEVKLNITFAANAAAASATLWVDYIYLDTEERKRFAQMSHEYLIDQLQFPGSDTMASGSNRARLNFNHPVKELVWKPSAGALSDIKLMLNGHDRFAARDGRYFTKLQKYYHHTDCSTTAGDDVYVYSFALRPEEHQPSGTCNFSRIDNATLTNTGSPGNTDIYAVNYNVLRVVSGMGGLAYSN